MKFPDPAVVMGALRENGNSVAGLELFLEDFQELTSKITGPSPVSFIYSIP